MASLADTPDLVGFFSYSREDDEGSGGRLSKLRERIQEELRGQLGRTKKDFRLWQDKASIAHGELWEDSIKTAIFESAFFIPIITPTAVKSHFCKFEFETFLARERELDRSNLVFPIVYIPVPALADDGWRHDPLLAIIGSRQYEQWQNLRHLDPSSTEVALRVEKLCENICKALQQPWLSPQERQEAEARHVAEVERHRQERLQEEARQQAEEESRRQEAEAKRRLDEAEAEKRRQDKERRKLEKEAAWAAKKAQGLHPLRRAAAAGAAVLALLLMPGGIWLYRTAITSGVTSAVVQPNKQNAGDAKAQATEEAMATPAGATSAVVQPNKQNAGNANVLGTGDTALDIANAIANMPAAKAQATAEAMDPQQAAIRELQEFMAKQELLATTLNNIAKQRHEMMKTVASNLRASDDNSNEQGDNLSARAKVELLGLQLYDLDDDLRQLYKIKHPVKGALVVGILSRSPVYKSLAPGDVVTGIGLEPVASADEVRAKIDKLKKDGRKSAQLAIVAPDGERRNIPVNIR
jgi:hypothetical protein